ncbi:MAG: fatty acid desaturase [Spongiibacteraceae bacterium]
MKMRYDDGLLPTAAALVYVLVMYIGGFALLLDAQWWSWPLGVLAVAHAMVIASYMIHECAHGAVFMKSQHNALLGRALLWINGASYGDYEAIKHKHMRHHFDRADVIAIDYREILQRHPLLSKLIVTLERIYIPAIDCLMHALVIILPFTDERYRAQRKRVLISLCARSSLLLALALYSWMAFAGYIVAYLLFEVVLRTMDMHQHTYEVFINLDQQRDAVKFDKACRDKNYEQRNTYSNPLGKGLLANWLVLNFGFHNAHHEKPSAPWYRLPAIDHELNYAEQEFDFTDVLRSYHQHRLTRVLNTDHGDTKNIADGIGFVGVLGVSFLTAI